MKNLTFLIYLSGTTHGNSNKNTFVFQIKHFYSVTIMIWGLNCFVLPSLKGLLKNPGKSGTQNVDIVLNELCFGDCSSLQTEDGKLAFPEDITDPLFSFF